LAGRQTPTAAQALTQRLLAELHPGLPPARAISLDSALEHDLGLDSLGRVDLAARDAARAHILAHCGGPDAGWV
jgi:hypothetical protein